MKITAKITKLTNSEIFYDARGLFKKGRFYQCAYCGKIVNRQSITIDHLVPVDKVVRLSIKWAEPRRKNCNVENGNRNSIF